MIENTVYQILNNIDDISDSIAGRIYCEFNANQTETQYLIYQKINHDRPLDVDGTGSIEVASFQIDIYSQQEDNARNIRDALVSALHGKSNSQYDENIQQIFVDSEQSDHSRDPDTFRITLTASFFF